MNLLVINAGSSSLKFQLIEMPLGTVISSGLVERIGLEHTKFHYTIQSEEFSEAVEFSNHKEALEAIAQKILSKSSGRTIDTIVHRVVHGGEQFSKTTIITKEVKDKIRELCALAPLHNPANLACIEVAEVVFPKATQVAVFDTAFHQTIPEKAYRYSIPNEFYDKHKIRQYGFHGTSHKYVSKKAIEFLRLKHSKIITVHLGNGCSITAVKDGESIEHSMGYGPTNGLIMGTRSGDVDQAIIFYLMDTLNYSSSQVQDLLQKESGLKGLTGFSDLRDIQNEAQKGNKECLLALQMMAYRVQKFIGSYIAALNGLDVLVFTAGIGENSDVMRSLICQHMDYFGIQLDEEKNKLRSKNIRSISLEGSKVPILVIPTNEEFEMAEQAYGLLT
ncbi:MAG TPA: acetate kinase [Flavobacterium sp.]|nr:acetate kinase [Crocinitomicaceae bacterium]MBP6584855.1 acetate kinase [Flavobacterium sp.]HRZ30981.1 acetate kinase [Flavobacterium sp.]HRZ73372.1 acetate kinase [Flavobacterium sp.]